MSSTGYRTISVVTVSRNAAATIADCLASVRGQSTEAEHVVVDGGSSDGTLALVARLGSATTAVLSGRDEGIYDAMNKGMTRCRGEIVGTLNADDFYAHDRVLERVARVFDDGNVDACYGDLLYVGQRLRAGGDGGSGGDTAGGAAAVFEGSSLYASEASGETARVFSLPGETIVRRWSAGSFGPRAFHWGWMPPHPTFFVRRRVYEELGGYRLDMGTAADYELMLRFLVRHGIRAAYLPEVLVKMRCGGASNRSLGSRLRANRMDRRAWAVNGLTPLPWTPWLKPLRKLGQWVRRPAPPGEKTIRAKGPVP
jgi:glycosyltransferase